ncbi:hypothetical protein [Lysobacter gummosus]|uniref:hypothetical protein n=1 Tax=Lysobacter gummosus TaxID=262324 RepID=UPI003640DE4A
MSAAAAAAIPTPVGRVPCAQAFHLRCLDLIASRSCPHRPPPSNPLAPSHAAARAGSR